MDYTGFQADISGYETDELVGSEQHCGAFARGITGDNTVVSKRIARDLVVCLRIRKHHQAGMMVGKTTLPLSSNRMMETIPHLKRLSAFPIPGSVSMAVTGARLSNTKPGSQY